ncbi:hypothetical protein EJ110_NYTH58762, partial [Nymphaea thermarum]
MSHGYASKGGVPYRYRYAIGYASGTALTVPGLFFIGSTPAIAAGDYGDGEDRQNTHRRQQRPAMCVLIGHEKEHVIEENEPVEKSGKYASWKGDNNIVMSWIMNSVQPQITSTIAYYTSAKQMWDFLKQTYSNDKNVSKILQVEEELLNLQQGDQSLAQYFVSLKSIYERLKALRPSCPTCHKTHGEQSMVAKFLQGLSPEYAVAKAQMLTGAEIPDLADAYNRLSRLAVTLSQPSSDLQASA